jgi:hypothetical protein
MALRRTPGRRLAWRRTTRPGGGGAAVACANCGPLLVALHCAAGGAVSVEVAEGVRSEVEGAGSGSGGEVAAATNEINGVQPEGCAQIVGGILGREQGKRGRR